MRPAAPHSAGPPRVSSLITACCLPGSQFKGVKPSGDRVLVKVDKEEGKTQGGVLLPTAAQNKPTAGAIVALGDVSLVKVRLWPRRAPDSPRRAPRHSTLAGPTRSARCRHPGSRPSRPPAAHPAGAHACAAHTAHHPRTACPPPPLRLPAAVWRPRAVLQVCRHRAGDQRRRPRAAQGAARVVFTGRGAWWRPWWQWGMWVRWWRWGWVW